jgi:hypothetical protein
LRIEIYRLEHQTTWSLEVVDEDGTSNVWNDQFVTDVAALNAAMRVIEHEGLSAFRDTSNVIQFRRGS